MPKKGEKIVVGMDAIAALIATAEKLCMDMFTEKLTGKQSANCLKVKLLYKNNVITVYQVPLFIPNCLMTGCNFQN